VHLLDAGVFGIVDHLLHLPRRRRAVQGVEGGEVGEPDQRQQREEAGHARERNHEAEPAADVGGQQKVDRPAEKADGEDGDAVPAELPDQVEPAARAFLDRQHQQVHHSSSHRFYSPRS
jgi:hypothetical protein